MTASGVMSNTLITIISVTLSVPLSLMKWETGSVHLSKKVKARCYTQHKHGFYVYAKPNLCDPKVVAKYIGRYPWQACNCHFQD